MCCPLRMGRTGIELKISMWGAHPSRAQVLWLSLNRSNLKGFSLKRFLRQEEVGWVGLGEGLATAGSSYGQRGWDYECGAVGRKGATAWPPVSDSEGKRRAIYWSLDPRWQQAEGVGAD